MYRSRVNQRFVKSLNKEFKASPFWDSPLLLARYYDHQRGLWLSKLKWQRVFIWASAVLHNAERLGPALRLKALNNGKLDQAVTIFPASTSFHYLPAFAYSLVPSYVCILYFVQNSLFLPMRVLVWQELCSLAGSRTSQYYLYLSNRIKIYNEVF